MSTSATHDKLTAAQRRRINQAARHLGLDERRIMRYLVGDTAHLAPWITRQLHACLNDDEGGRGGAKVETATVHDPAVAKFTCGDGHPQNAQRLRTVAQARNVLGGPA